MALSLNLCEGVEPNEWTFERTSQRLTVSFPIRGHGLETANGRLWNWESCVSCCDGRARTQGEKYCGKKVDLHHNTDWVCTSQGGVDSEWSWEEFCPRVPLSHAMTPTERVYVGWTAKFQLGSLWVTHIGPHRRGQHLHVSLIPRTPKVQEWYLIPAVFCILTLFPSSLSSALKVLEETWRVGIMELKKKVGKQWRTHSPVQHFRFPSWVRPHWGSGGTFC